MIVHIDCELCNRTKTEELSSANYYIHLSEVRCCSRCRAYMAERATYIKDKLAALSRWPRWLRAWKYGIDFDEIQSYRIKYDIPQGGFVSPKNYAPMPDVKPPKPDAAPVTDIGALANLIIQGFDTAHDKDVTVSLTYRRVGDVVDASGTIEIIDVRPVTSGESQADIDALLARADEALRDEPMSMAGCSAEDVDAAEEAFGEPVMETPNYIRRCLEDAPPSGYASIDSQGRISDPDGPLERQLGHTERAQREWLMAAAEHKLNQLGFLWIALQHALRKHPEADIRSPDGDGKLYSEVREIMVGDKHGKRD